MSLKLFESVVFIDHNMRLLKNIEDGGAAKRRKRNPLTADVHGEPTVGDEEAERIEEKDEEAAEALVGGVPLVDEIPLEADVVDEDDDFVENFEEGNGIEIDVEAEACDGVPQERSEAWWFNERNAREAFLKYGPEEFDIDDFYKTSIETPPARLGLAPSDSERPSSSARHHSGSRQARPPA